MLTPICPAPTPLESESDEQSESDMENNGMARVDDDVKPAYTMPLTLSVSSLDWAHGLHDRQTRLSKLRTVHIRECVEKRQPIRIAASNTTSNAKHAHWIQRGLEANTQRSAPQQAWKPVGSYEERPSEGPAGVNDFCIFRAEYENPKPKAIEKWASAS